jgi:hypothetical protein
MDAHKLAMIGSFIARAWGVIGPLVGVVIGAWLSRSWQRKQWVLDSKKAEYRELLSTLSQSIHSIMSNWEFPAEVVKVDEQIKEQRQRHDAYFAGEKVLKDRIFIDKKVHDAGIFQRWEKLEIGPGEAILKKFWAAWTDIHDTLVKMAHEDLGIKD